MRTEDGYERVAPGMVPPEFESRFFIEKHEAIARAHVAFNRGLAVGAALATCAFVGAAVFM